MHEVQVNRLGVLSLPRKSVVRLTDHPDKTLDVYRGHKTTMQLYTNVMYILVLELELYFKLTLESIKVYGYTII